jgi:hypothetical protein
MIIKLIIIDLVLKILIVNAGLPQKCTFIFYSDENSHGIITSPQYPNENYPADYLCRYEFYSIDNERLILDVLDFELEKAELILSLKQTNTLDNYSKRTSINESFKNQTQFYQCFYDYLDVFDIDSNGLYHFNSRFCGNKIPKRLIAQTSHTLIVFSSDRTQQLTGFKISFYYSTLNVLPFRTNVALCGDSELDGENGLIEMHLIEQEVHCAWSIQVHDYKRILIKFQQMNFTQSKIFVWEERVLNEDEANFTITHEAQSYLELRGRYLSKSNRLVIRFIGYEYDSFSIIWTAVYETIECLEFQCTGGEYCSSSNDNKCVQVLVSIPFCISQSLICNNYSNCDTGDSSDELSCINDGSLDFKFYKLLVSIILLALILPVVYIILNHYWVKWRSNKKETPKMFKLVENSNQSQNNELKSQFKEDIIIIENKSLKKNSSFLQAIHSNSTI